jgi:iron complex outermembrane recepter protein
MFQLRRISHAVLTLCAGSAVSGALAQQPATSAPPPQRLERVEITGSNIKRIANETASPVQVYSRTDIKKTGANTTRQVLDTMTSSSTTELRDDGNSSSFASGGTGASLRGLGKSATLVLLNGRRIAYFALADGGQEQFVNIDAIPVDAIERIEVLKDGASAIYGSDAMAGVINIITRSSYEGVGISTSYQSPHHPRVGTQSTIGLIAGKGNLGTDKYNIFINAELYKRDGYTLSDVKDAYAPWHKKIVNPAFGDPSLSSWPGNFFSGTVNPDGSFNTGDRFANPNCPVSQRNSAGACTTNINHLNPVSDPAERVNVFTAGRLALSDQLELFSELSYSHTTTKYQQIPFAINTPGTPYRWFDGNTGTVQVVNKPILTVDGRPVGLEYRFMDNLGMWKTPAEATQYRAQAGFKGSAGDWDWETSIARLAADGTKSGIGADRTAFINALTSGDYVVGGTNSQALLDRMFRRTETRGNNSQTVLDGKVSGELFTLPAGGVQAAFGVEHRDESLKIQSSQNVLDAQIISNGAIWIEGERKLDAAFAEVEAPLLKGVTANGALRFDRASGFDSHVSPKLGLRIEASPTLLLRGTAAGGFRAPNIPETQGKIGLTGFFNNTVDPRRCETATRIRDILKNGNANDKQDATQAFNSGCLVSVPAMISSNPGLKPELSKSFTVGFVLAPSSDFSAAFDYFSIERYDEISSRDTAYVLAREGLPGYIDAISRAGVSGDDKRRADRANQLDPSANISWDAGQLTTLLLQYENFGKTQSSGIDIDMKGRIALQDEVQLLLDLNATYMLRSRAWDIDANTYRPSRVGLRNMPRLRAVFSAAWAKGPWTTGLRFNYTSRMALNNDETDAATWGEAACQARLKPGNLPCYRKDDLRIDMNLRYTGFKDLGLALNIGNLTGAELPVNLRDGYALRPRTVKLGAEYKF